MTERTKGLLMAIPGSMSLLALFTYLLVTEATRLPTLLGIGLGVLVIVAIEGLDKLGVFG